MKNKIAWKRIGVAFAWLASLTGLVVLMSFISLKESAVVCKGVKVYIPGNEYFIDRAEVDHILQVSSNTLIGRRMDHINIHELENKLQKNPFIRLAEVFADMDGIIRVEITQRHPVLRIMNRLDQDFYVDEQGYKIPLSNNFTAQVLAANGNIDELFANRVDTLHTKLAKDVYATADHIRKDSLWNAQIAQIYVDNNHEIQLIPRVGDHRILLGNADSLDRKFHNLEIFYKQALPKVGWDRYKVINIKYANQVVGIKNDGLTDSTAIRQVKPKLRADTLINNEQRSKDTSTAQF
ncbi:cell division protein FtsQ [Mucilaginibacter daejeonensis]|uniref:cell division protein FtsQ/DivIB n=1 Tax=Mucilaginibacter daejeonensis TaxID=398049 RepID=UPI001D17BC7D|nr:cell division protein FtsQ [Mucilaginibacter daejeonensis]UEG54273.1 cell division protein FtsQ [Mucilaginibacter daejeonensis]